MKCIKCEQELQPGAKFCNRCGTKQPDLLRCSKCGKNDIHHEAVYCPECGNRVSTANLTEVEKSSREWKNILEESDAEVKSLREDKHQWTRETARLQNRIEAFTKSLAKKDAEVRSKEKEIKERDSCIDELQTVISEKEDKFSAENDKLRIELSSVKNSLSHWTHRANELDTREKDLTARSKKLEDDYKNKNQKLEREYNQRNEFLHGAEAKLKDRENRCRNTESENNRLRHKVSVMRNGGKETWWIVTLRLLCLTFAVFNIAAFVYSDVMAYLDNPFPREEHWWSIMGVILSFSFVIGIIGLAKPSLGGSKFIRFCASLTPMTIWEIYPYFSGNSNEELPALRIAFVVILFGVCGAIFCATTFIRNKVYFDSDLD